MGCASGAQVWIGVEVSKTKLDTDDLYESISELVEITGTKLDLDYPIISDAHSRFPSIVGVNIIDIDWSIEEMCPKYLAEKLEELTPNIAIALDVFAKDVKVFINSSYF